MQNFARDGPSQLQQQQQQQMKPRQKQSFGSPSDIMTIKRVGEAVGCSKRRRMEEEGGDGNEEEIEKYTI